MILKTRTAANGAVIVRAGVQCQATAARVSERGDGRGGRP